jgi:hypothetical protein
MDWINLSEDRDQWCTLMNMVIGILKFFMKCWEILE